jgi:hypothetical protein
MRRLVLAVVATAIATSAGPGFAQSDGAALREQAKAALRRAAEFYRTKVATHGAYQRPERLSGLGVAHEVVLVGRILLRRVRHCRDPWNQSITWWSTRVYARCLRRPG